jgi:sec-independent protein translocase protein TatC
MNHKFRFLVELRQRLLYFLYCFAALFAILFYFSQSLFHTLALPLLDSLAPSQTMIATHVAAPLFVPLKFALFLAFVLGLPSLFYQIWRFVAPALYRHERAACLAFVVGGCLLFLAGMSFAYFVVFPVLFHFFFGLTPTHIQIMPDISAYLGFTLQLLLAFGVVFEVPLVTVIVLKTGLVTAAQAKAARPYVVVGSFIVGMLLTPPDVVSQVLLAVPMCLLYELGLWVGIAAAKSRTLSKPEDNQAS